MYAAHAQKERKEASQLELPKCLKLLEKATSDNDKFSAILEITKQIRSNTFTEDDRRVVLQSMGLQFLSRLIKTTSLPKGCSSNLYKSIALSLLSSICIDESVLVQPEMNSFLSVIKDILLHSRDKDLMRNAEMQQMAVDSLNILSHMAQHSNSAQKLVTSGLFNTLIDIMISPHCCNPLKVFSLISAIVKHSSHLFVKNTEKLESIMEKAAQNMSKGSDMREKIEYARAMTMLLNHTPEVDYNINSDWVHQLMKVLLKLVPVKMVPEHSEVVFYLLSAIVTRLSIQVLVLGGKDIVTPVKALVARIAVEIYMLLDGIGPDNATARYPQMDQVYKLLSEMIQFIFEEFAETADPDTIISLYRKLVDISNTIMEFLTSIANQEVAVPRNHGVVLISVRVLAAMLTEVTEDPTPALVNLIPFFNLLCQNIEYADDVKLEVKNVTQAALENIKMMALQPIREDSLDEVNSVITDASDLASSQTDHSENNALSTFSRSQSFENYDSQIRSLSDLHLSCPSPGPSQTSTSNDSQAVQASSEGPQQAKSIHTRNNVSRSKKREGNIHTTLFYVPEGTKGIQHDPSLKTDSMNNDENSDLHEHFEEVKAEDDSNLEDVFSMNLSQEIINDFLQQQSIMREDGKAKQLSECQRIKAAFNHRRKKNDSLSKSEEKLISSEVWKLTPDDILGFLLPSYMFLLGHNEVIKVMVKCDLFQTVVNFIQRSTSETLEGISSSIPESTTINALKVIHHFYECHPDVASTQLCLLDLLELSILSIPNLVGISKPPPLTCLKMIEASLFTLILNSGIRKRRSALHRIKHSRHRFFNAVVDYLVSFYEFKQNRRQHLTLYVKEGFKCVWGTAADFWCGCVEGLCSLVKTEEDLQEIMVKSSMLPFFSAFLAQNDDPSVKNFPESSEKVLKQVLHLIESAAESSNALRGFLLQCKGLLIARKYKLEKMELHLNQHQRLH